MNSQNSHMNSNNNNKLLSFPRSVLALAVVPLSTVAAAAAVSSSSTLPMLDSDSITGLEASKKNLKLLLPTELRNSDVGSLGRMVLPEKDAEANLPTLTAREGMLISMEDMHTSQIWNFKYRCWPNNKNCMYVLENTGEFVKSHALQPGYFIMFYKALTGGKCMIRGRIRDESSRGGMSSCSNNMGEKECGGGLLLQSAGGGGSGDKDVEVSSKMHQSSSTDINGGCGVAQAQVQSQSHRSRHNRRLRQCCRHSWRHSRRI